MANPPFTDLQRLFNQCRNQARTFFTAVIFGEPLDHTENIGILARKRALRILFAELIFNTYAVPKMKFRRMSVSERDVLRKSVTALRSTGKWDRMDASASASMGSINVSFARCYCALRT